MDNNIVFVSHGDIILDNVYDSNFNLIKQDGGGSNWNTLYNLALMGEKCYAIGSVGNDEEGKIALSSLIHANVDISNIVHENIRTNIMNILIPTNSNLKDDSILHCWYSPITNKCTFHFSENLPVSLPAELENKSVFVLLDKFESVNLQFVNNINNKKLVLDVGHIRFVEHFSTPYLHDFFSKANLMQLNQNVSTYLFDRFHVENEIDFFKLFNLDLLVLTMGSKGAKFIYKDKENLIQCIEKNPEIIARVVDSSGAGDAFLSTLIRQYAYYNNIDVNFIDTTFKLANKSSRDIISQVGSRKV